MTTDPTVVVFGSINMDIVLRMERRPDPGETLTGQGHTLTLGGKGANQAVAAARLGASTSRMVGAVGNDSHGQAALAELGQYGVDTSLVTCLPEVETGIAHIWVTADGENSIVLTAGSNSHLTHLTDAHREAISEADVLMLQLETPLSGVIEAAHVARKADTLVVLTPAPAQPLPEELLHNVDVVVPNQTELMQLTDPTLTTEQAAARLHMSGPAVLTTLGASGARWTTSEIQMACPTAPTSKVVDTTGAGDVFTAAFAVHWYRHREAQAAMHWAASAASLMVGKQGAAPAIPDLDAVSALAASWGQA